MENEKRLISAEQAYEVARLHHHDFAQSLADLTSLREVLEDCDTVDAVEVVRCKDCEYRKKDDVGRNYCGLGDFYCGDTDYCSRGKKKMVNLEDIVDLDAQTAKNNEAMRKVIAFMAGERKDNE